MMDNNISIEPGFNVIGIAIRTSNAEAFAQGTIQQLWGRFFAESVMGNIPNKIDHAMVAVYYDYESDYNGYYNLLLGARVSSLDGIPAGMVAYHVQPQKSRIFVSESGPLSRVCVELWQKIWLLEDEHALSRAYVADYELYDERSKNPHDGRVAIFIGIK